MPQRTWLMKSEPGVFSLDDLRRARGATTGWDGVRNFQARNLLRDEIKPGDRVLFYHSSADPPAAVGTAIVTRGGYPDASQFDPASDHHDPDARPDAPRWYSVDIKFERAFAKPVTLAEMRTMPALANMVLLRKGSRLSVQPVTAAEWAAIVKRGG